MRITKAKKLKVGDWIQGSAPGHNQRVVEVSETRDGQVKVSVDYGNGGEPGTMFFEPDEIIAVV